MLVFKTVTALRKHLEDLQKDGKTIGLVPTMGALHEGHLSLIRQSKNENNITVCSIYVNPAQFNNPNDLAKYPRTVDSDKEMLEKAACDILFLPEDAEMYPQVAQLKFFFGYLEEVMEAKHRKGHFNGVGLVIAKLFHLIAPDRAYFGQKDLQQCAVISLLVRELFFNTTIIICPTLREPDGLAMSSRNRRLSPEQRQAAPMLYRTLQDAKTDLQQGKKIEKIKEEVHQFFKLRTDIKLEYFEIVDGVTLQPLPSFHFPQPIAICIAAYFGEVRLIDNLLI
ncbi:MAG: pantoate--beta-alanine ligase [Verrucomicrobia bacterium]|nr:pantoate--beta-alanine ligase [Cytophagales bacterium]